MSADDCAKMRSIAEDAILCYAQGLLSAEVLVKEMLKEWEARRVGEEQPPMSLFKRIAQRICSRELCAACCSSDPHIRNDAFGNLRHYLERSLRRTRYAGLLQQYENSCEDVLNQTLETIHDILIHRPCAGPNDPAALLKWTQVILIRQAHVFLQKRKSESDACVSFDAQEEDFAEQFVDGQNADPQEYVLFQELQLTLKDAILSLPNLRYQQVLMYTYLAGIDESELARRWQVQVQDIYMWRYRALKSLRSKPEVIQALRPWQ